jgi:hypothetical protein
MSNLLRAVVLPLVISSCLGAFFASAAFGSEDYGKISVQELKASLGDPDQVIIDVRDSNSWSSSKLKISGAIRENADDVGSWENKYPKDKRIVLY